MVCSTLRYLLRWVNRKGETGEYNCKCYDSGITFSQTLSFWRGENINISPMTGSQLRNKTKLLSDFNPQNES